MKKIQLYLILISLITILSNVDVYAQKATVTNAIDDIGEGYNSSYRIYIPNCTVSMVEDDWVKFLKKNDAKVKSSKGTINGKNMVIAGLGKDSLNVFSKVAQQDSGVLITAAFQKGGEFIGPKSDESYSRQLEQILTDLAKKEATTGINLKVGAAVEILNTKTKEQSKLSSNLKELSSENEEMKAKIKKNEDSITKINTRLDQLKTELQSQQSIIENIKAKTKDL